MLRAFRIVALFEGVTSALLFFVAMPLKYLLDWPHLVPPVGMIHGLAWIVYTVAIPVCLIGRGFTVVEMVKAFIAGLLPAGTFFTDPMIHRHIRLRDAERRM